MLAPIAVLLHATATAEPVAHYHGTPRATGQHTACYDGGGRGAAALETSLRTLLPGAVKAQAARATRGTALMAAPPPPTTSHADLVQPDSPALRHVT